jgi:hypothetical protein
MGKPTRNELLANYYLRAAGVAAVWIDAEGNVGAQDVAKVDVGAGLTVYCYPRGAQFVLAYRLQLWMAAQPERPDQPAVAAKLEELADRGRVGLTPHAVALDRALAAVAAVNETIDKMGSTGEIKAFNRAFKEARRVDPSIRYFDYLHARKAAMLEALARNLMLHPCCGISGPVTTERV